MRNGSSERVSLDRTAGIVEAFVESAPIGFAFLDRELRFVRVNARMAEINGVPPAAHVGRRLQEVVPELPVESYLPVLERALAGEVYGSGRVDGDDAEPAGGHAVVVGELGRRCADRLVRSSVLPGSWSRSVIANVLRYS